MIWDIITMLPERVFVEKISILFNYRVICVGDVVCGIWEVEYILSRKWVV